MEENPEYAQRLVLRKASDQNCYQAVYGTPSDPKAIKRFDRTSLVLDSLLDIVADFQEEVLDVTIEDSFLEPLNKKVDKEIFEEEEYLLYQLLELYGKARGIKMNLRELELRLIHKDDNKEVVSKLKDLSEAERYT
ncbi:hypothetical protein B6U80_02060 [Candidatus Pacearchaeota archaeon ex4484_26]|nr:MAG: hypothetical protein B6U80_02060 [Candidatus Pacearchaeota archaeon ex4484_26]